MHSGEPCHLVKQRLARLVREYQQQGYTVISHPSSEHLPDALRACAFDLIAQREEAVIAAVVRTPQTLSLGGVHDLCWLAERVEYQPHWVLDLVIIHPLEHRTDPAQSTSKAAS